MYKCYGFSLFINMFIPLAILFSLPSTINEWKLFLFGEIYDESQENK